VKARLRVVHVLQSVDGGGPGHATELACHAAQRGAAVIVCAPGRLASLPCGVMGVELPSARLGRTLSLARLARQADLLHAHGIRAAIWALPALLYRPSIVTLHGLHPLRRPAGPAYRLAGIGLLSAIGVATDIIICVSDSDLQRVRGIPLASRKARLVSNGIARLPPVTDEERDRAREELAIAEGTLTVVFLGRLDEPKDPYRTLEVARTLEHEDVLFLMAGGGELEEIVRSVAPPNVRVLGHQSNPRRVLAAGDVVLNTSLWEGLPLALMEAMAVGVPVVASNVEGNSEALGNAGTLVAQDDVQAFGAAILSMRESTSRQTLAQAARRRVAELFSLDRMLAQTDALYAEVLGRIPW
jgi:glycosyltransferase involved in cell wall biosynthesis